MENAKALHHPSVVSDPKLGHTWPSSSTCLLEWQDLHPYYWNQVLFEKETLKLQTSSEASWRVLGFPGFSTSVVNASLQSPCSASSRGYHKVQSRLAVAVEYNSPQNPVKYLSPNNCVSTLRLCYQLFYCSGVHTHWRDHLWVRIAWTSDPLPNLQNYSASLLFALCMTLLALAELALQPTAPLWAKARKSAMASKSASSKTSFTPWLLKLLSYPFNDKSGNYFIQICLVSLMTSFTCKVPPFPKFWGCTRATKITPPTRIWRNKGYIMRSCLRNIHDSMIGVMNMQRHAAHIPTCHDDSWCHRNSSIEPSL